MIACCSLTPHFFPHLQFPQHPVSPLPHLPHLLSFPLSSILYHCNTASNTLILLYHPLSFQFFLSVYYLFPHSNKPFIYSSPNLHFFIILHSLFLLFFHSLTFHNISHSIFFSFSSPFSLIHRLYISAFSFLPFLLQSHPISFFLLSPQYTSHAYQERDGEEGRRGTKGGEVCWLGVASNRGGEAWWGRGNLYGIFRWGNTAER